jgi:hypothetical protein
VVAEASLALATGAAVVIAVHAVATVVRLRGAWWWQDDFNILGVAADQPLGIDLLLRDYNGHLQPATWLMAWLVSHFSPYAWWTAAVTQTIFVIATDIAFFALLRRLFGVRPAILVPLAAFCASAITLTATMWWAAALQWLPVSLSLALALLFHVKYLDGGRRRDGIAAVAAVASGLFCFEKALTVLPVLAFFSLFYLSHGPWWKRPFVELRRVPRYWAAHAVLAVGWLVLYQARTTGTASPAADFRDTVELGRQLVLYNVIPGILGGPIDWFGDRTSIVSWPAPPPAVRYVSWGIAGALLLGSLMLRRGAWRGWLILALYMGVTIALVAHARGAIYGPSIGRDLRYSTDLALLAPLCAALAWLPLKLRATARPDAPKPPQDDDVVRGWTGRRPLVLIIGSLAIVLVTVGGLISGAHFTAMWSRNPAKAYVDHLRDDLARGTPVLLFDQPVPPQIMIPEFGAAAQLSRLTRPLDPRPRFVTWAPQAHLVDDAGRIRPAKVEGVGSYLFRPVCGSGKVTVPLTGSLLAWTWKVQISYTSTIPTAATVAVGGKPAQAALLPGKHDLFVAVTGSGPLVTITGLNPSARVCVSSAVLGNLVPR